MHLISFYQLSINVVSCQTDNNRLHKEDNNRLHTEAY